MMSLRRIPLLLAAVVALSCDEQQPIAPRSTPSLSKNETSPPNPCVQDKDRDNRSAPVHILCAISVPGNPLTNVAKAWFSHPRNSLYIDDQSNKGVDVIDLKTYAFVGRVPGFVGVATTGGGTATTNGQGPNSMALAEGHHMWVSDGNSQVHQVDLQTLEITQTVSTAIAACDGGTATTHYCGRTNEMTYDPDDHLIIVTNPNPLDVNAPHAALPPYVSFIDTHAPYAVLGTIAFPDARGTPEAPVWNQKTKRLLLPIPTCNNAATCNPTDGGTVYIAVIDPKALAVEQKFVMPTCHALFPAVSPAPTGMMNDMSIDEKDQTVIMPACGRGEVVFDAGTGAVISVIDQIAGSDQTWFNPGDGNFYLAANDPNNANTRSLGVVDGRTGQWLQNVAAVGGVIPTASDNPANRVFITVTASAATNACTPFGLAATGCVIVFEHEDLKPDKKT